MRQVFRTAFETMPLSRQRTIVLGDWTEPRLRWPRKILLLEVEALSFGEQQYHVKYLLDVVRA